MDPGALRDAYTFSLERFDLQYTFLTTDRFLGEQVTIHSARRGRGSRLVVLPERDRELQVSMRAHNEGGDNLVILSKARLDEMYREVFTAGLGHIAAYDDISEPIQELLVEVPPWDAFFGGAWFDDVRADEQTRADTEEFLRGVFGDIGEIVNDQEAAAEAFIDYVIKHLDESYRPCVLLESRLETDGRRPAALVKYEVEGATGLSKRKRFVEALLGFGYEVECSSHLRLTAPPGMVFNHPVRAPPGCILFHPGRDELQAYYTRSDAQTEGPTLPTPSPTVRPTALPRPPRGQRARHVRPRQHARSGV